MKSVRLVLHLRNTGPGLLSRASQAVCLSHYQLLSGYLLPVVAPNLILHCLTNSLNEFRNSDLHVIYLRRVWPAKPRKFN